MRSHGFTLIELMIVVAIIGILAAIAVPMYNNYFVRTQTAEANSLVGGLETAFNENYSNTGVSASSNGTLGFNNSIRGSYVNNVALTNPGQITATFGANAVNVINGMTIIYSAYRSPNGDVVWLCNNGTATQNAIATQNLVMVNGGTAASSGTILGINPEYLPEVCR